MALRWIQFVASRTMIVRFALRLAANRRMNRSAAVPVQSVERRLRLVVVFPVLTIVAILLLVLFGAIIFILGLAATFATTGSTSVAPAFFGCLVALLTLMGSWAAAMLSAAGAVFDAEDVVRRLSLAQMTDDGLVRLRAYATGFGRRKLP